METPNPLKRTRIGFNPCLTAGLDEAGRGCLAGPVVAAAVILNPAKPVSGLADSKTLSRKKREDLQKSIKANALAWSIGISWQKRIDRINILQATLEAMARAVCVLKTHPESLLIDGLFIIPENMLAGKIPHLPEQSAIVGGDQSRPAISAASILAKCFRDRLMITLSRKWPEYGFAKHKGYGTREHIKALEKFGPCPLHRMTFKRVRPSGGLPLLPESESP